MTSESEQEQEVPVDVASLFGAKAQRGLVALSIGEARTTMPPAKAREIAGMLWECAEGAETDELLVTYFRKRVGMELEQTVPLLRDFRAVRAEFHERDTTDTTPPSGGPKT